MHLQTSTTTTAPTGSMMAPFPSLPASPTLTNPEMILPYGDYNEDHTPSRQQHGFLGDELGEGSYSIGPPHVALGPVAATTPIIYGNGTMLSDIGEVTEVESTPGRKLPGPAERRMLKQAQGTSFRSSSTIGQNTTRRMRNGSHARKYSMESNSTATSEGKTPVDHFKDFDAGSVMDDSNFQGDDEESLASYSDEVFATKTQRLSIKESNISQEDDLYSSVALSRRAEQILLNAKKRLNNMEGNLTRARSSLSITPSSSISSLHSTSPLSRSTPSPSDSDQRMYHRFGSISSRDRQSRTTHDGHMGSPGHARVYSETSIVPSRLTAFPVRASSAAARYIGRDGSESSQRLLLCSDSSDAPLEQPHNSSRSGLSLSRTSPPRGLLLESLGEHDVAAFEREEENPSADEWQLDGSGNHRLTRSASSMQMRDLRDQMQDLKGRLSVLRDRARDDSMRRRSLQSLRTPSPFTAAEQWYTEAKTYETGGLGADANVVHFPLEDGTSDLPSSEAENKIGAPISAVEPAEYPQSEGTSVYEDVRESHDTLARREDDPPILQAGREVDSAVEDEFEVEDVQGDNGYNDEIVEREELDDYESDTSLYHDTVDVPISHEDREDAFDYEHFFLHSAMGTISQAGRRCSVSSFGSEDSVETARGPPAPRSPTAVQRPSLRHRRNESSETISTVATFATANEDTFPHYGEGQQSYAVQYVSTQPCSQSPVTGKRTIFGTQAQNGHSENGRMSPQQLSKSSSAVHDGIHETGNFHRPSVASFDSFDSVGTTRSFPLVNKPISQQGSREGSKLASTMSKSVISTASREQLQSSPVNMLAREDQILVERLVASLGKCVLGLQEGGRASYEGRLWRRRLDAARRVLEGQEGAV